LYIFKQELSTSVQLRASATDDDSANNEPAIASSAILFMAIPLLISRWRNLSPEGYMSFHLAQGSRQVGLPRRFDAIAVAARHWHSGLPPRDPFQPGGLLSLGKPGLIDACSPKPASRASRPRRSLRRSICRRSSTTLPLCARPPARSCKFSRVSKRQRERGRGRDRGKLAAFNVAGGWEGPNELLLTVGRR